MSRIGKKIIPVPKGVTVTVKGESVTVQGPKGTLVKNIMPQVTVEVADATVQCSAALDRLSKQAWGLMRMLIQNMIIGVTDGYKKTLDIHGVGYKAEAKGKEFVITVGYSHPVVIVPEEGISIKAENPTRVTIEGIDKEKVGRLASEIRKIRKPEPYKGKGIHYAGEKIRRKVGKAAGK